jgi:ABC-2 type transport system ATP-binding protein
MPLFHIYIAPKITSLTNGHIYGIVGKNGSGKTMLLRAISGLILPSSGEIWIDGKVLGKNISFPPDMGLLIEKPDFLSHLSGFENLKFLAEIKKTISLKQIESFLRMFELDPKSTKPMKKYSQGMKQKIGLVQAIIYAKYSSD